MKFNIATPLVDEFRREPTAQLARKIWVICHCYKFEIPDDVMEFFVEETYKQIRDYDEKHPPTDEQRERMEDVCLTITNAEALGRTERGYKNRIYKAYADLWGYEKEDSGREGWEKVKDDYASFLRKYKD